MLCYPAPMQTFCLRLPRFYKISHQRTVIVKNKEVKNDITSYIVPLSHHPTNTATSAIRAGLAVLIGSLLNSTMWVHSLFFLSLVLPTKEVQNILFRDMFFTRYFKSVNLARDIPPYMVDIYKTCT